MMAFTFQKATKQSARLRMAITGVSGSGKTFTALRIACAMSDKVALIDTERGSASKYADKFDFSVLELDKFSPEDYTGAIKAAQDAGFDTLVIDSFSHAWMGKGGILEMHDNATSADKKGDSFRAWSKVTPKHNALLDAILTAKMNVIATMRSKAEYSMTPDANRPGKSKVEKIGLAPVQRDGVEYEFDVVGQMDLNNTMFIEKTRCSELRDKSFELPGEDVAGILINWLSVDGTPPVDKPDKATPIAKLTINAKWSQEKQTMIGLLNSMSDVGFTLEQAQTCLPTGTVTFAGLADEDIADTNERLSVMLDGARVPAVHDGPGPKF